MPLTYWLTRDQDSVKWLTFVPFFFILHIARMLLSRGVFYHSPCSSGMQPSFYLATWKQKLPTLVTWSFFFFISLAASFSLFLLFLSLLIYSASFPVCSSLPIALAFTPSPLLSLSIFSFGSLPYFPSPFTSSTAAPVSSIAPSAPHSPFVVHYMPVLLFLLLKPSLFYPPTSDHSLKPYFLIVSPFLVLVLALVFALVLTFCHLFLFFRVLIFFPLSL